MKALSDSSLYYQNETKLFSISWFALVVLLFLYMAQHVRPQTLIGFTTFPLFSLLAFPLLFLLILHGNLIALRNFVQIRYIFFLLLWLASLTLLSNFQGRAFTEYMAFINQFFFVIGAIVLIDTTRKLRVVIQFISTCVIFIVIHTLFSHEKFERYALFNNLSNFLVDPNDLSLYLNLMIPFLLLSVATVKTVWIKSFFGIGAILTMLISLLTYSRGGFLGFLITMTVLTLLSKKRVILILGMIFIALIILPTLSSDWLLLMKTATNSESPTAQTRLIMWNALFELFLNNPLGYGPGTTGNTAYLLISDFAANRHYLHWQGDVGHSFWLTALMEWGIIGFIILISIIVINFIDCFKLCFWPAQTEEQIFLSKFGQCCLASLCGFLISASFLTVNYYPHFWYLTAFIVIGSALYSQQKGVHDARR